jgi:hypothetical protein
MEASAARLGRLYDLYQQHFGQLRADVIAVNRSLGSRQPEKTWAEPLNRTEFESLIIGPTDEPEKIRRFVQRLIRGHEHEFADLRVA